MAEAIYDEAFGRLTWDSRLGCWLGGLDWPPGPYLDVAIWHPEDDLLAGLRMAHDGLAWLQAHEGDARRCVADELLEVYNEAWRDEEEPITVDAFVRRIALVRVAFEEDGSLGLSYDGGDLFGGQVINAEFGPDRSFRGTNLVG